MSEDRIKQLEEMLAQLIEDGLWATDYVGIYPMSVENREHPEDSYEQRTPEMEEHNERAKRFLKRLIEAEKLLGNK